jgi:hypothetical protein
VPPIQWLWLCLLQMHSSVLLKLEVSRLQRVGRLRNQFLLHLLQGHRGVGDQVRRIQVF